MEGNGWTGEMTTDVRITLHPKKMRVEAGKGRLEVVLACRACREKVWMLLLVVVSTEDVRCRERKCYGV